MKGRQTSRKTCGIPATSNEIGLLIKSVCSFLSLLRYHIHAILSSPFCLLCILSLGSTLSYASAYNSLCATILDPYFCFGTSSCVLFHGCLFRHPGCNSWVRQFKADAQKEKSERQSAAQTAGKRSHINFSSSKDSAPQKKSRFQPYGTSAPGKEPTTRQKTRWG